MRGLLLTLGAGGFNPLHALGLRGEGLGASSSLGCRGVLGFMVCAVTKSAVSRRGRE